MGQELGWDQDPEESRVLRRLLACGAPPAHCSCCARRAPLLRSDSGQASVGPRAPAPPAAAEGSAGPGSSAAVEGQQPLWSRTWGPRVSSLMVRDTGFGVPFGFHL